ncbi:MAG TPA: T9SS type A sorting domain-containing protein [Rubricoccaceae bacterium]|jgi:uncharacterized delta-60 repeat protein
MRLLYALLITLAAGAHAQTGTLDPTFGTGGRVILDPSGTLESAALAAAVLPDGRVLLAGEVGGDAAVLRLTASGALDPTYGEGGLRRVDLGGPNDVFADLALLPDGSVVAAGAEVDGDNIVAGAALARLTPAGHLDGTFGAGGLVLEADRSVVLFLSVAVQPDGRVVAVGQKGGVENRVVAARYGADGAPDPSFGTDGLALPDLGDVQTSTFAHLALDGSGRLAIAAWFFPTDDIFDAAFLAFRLTAQGALDLSFGGDGTVVTDLGPTFDVPLAIVVGPDGRVTLGGQATDFLTGESDLVLVRYTADGTLDAGFGAGGIVRTGAFGTVGAASDLALQSDGKLLVAGSAGTNEDTDFVLARFTAGGEPDIAFGTGGRALADFGASAAAQALAFGADGLAVLAGASGAADGTSGQIAVARFVTDGRPSATEEPGAAGPLALAAAPNPFGPSAALTLTLREAGAARVAVYDALGRRVAVLHDGPLAAGERTFRLDGSALAPGVYVVRAEGPAGGAALRLVRR